MEAKWMWLIAGIVVGGAIVYIVSRQATRIVTFREEEKGFTILDKVVW